MKKFKPNVTINNATQDNKDFSEFENILCQEIQLHIFSFFNQKNLREAAHTSKNFRRLSHQTIETLQKKNTRRISFILSAILFIYQNQIGLDLSLI